MVVTHNCVAGLLAAKWFSETKTCSNQFSKSRDVPFVHIHQTGVTGIRTVALIKEEEGGVKPRKTEVNIKR